MQICKYLILRYVYDTWNAVCHFADDATQEVLILNTEHDVENCVQGFSRSLI